MGRCGAGRQRAGGGVRTNRLKRPRVAESLTKYLNSLLRRMRPHDAEMKQRYPAAFRAPKNAGGCIDQNVRRRRQAGLQPRPNTAFGSPVPHWRISRKAARVQSLRRLPRHRRDRAHSAGIAMQKLLESPIGLSREKCRHGNGGQTRRSSAHQASPPEDDAQQRPAANPNHQPGRQPPRRQRRGRCGP